MTKTYREKTRLVHMGRDPEEYFGIVNPPLVRTSTILYPSVAAFEDPHHQYRYGNLGTPLSDKIEAAAAELEGACGAVSVQTGMAAITVPLTAFLEAGDHVLITDSVYDPTRNFCDKVLRGFGVEVEYYDPLAGAGIGDLFRKNTRVVYMESPGSSTFEVQDVPAIAAAAKDKDIVTVIDNTWAGGLLFRPLEHGVDISLIAGTKYIGGHADVNLGLISAADEEHLRRIRNTSWNLGMMAPPEDIYLALRGLRTMEMRLRQSAEHALAVAQWLQKRPEVQKVYYPPLPDDPGYALWKRDFSGAAGLLSFLLQPSPKKAWVALAEGLALFPIGSSWGGYESLLQPQYLKKNRTAVPWTEEGKLLRLQIGLEDPQDLIEDLEQGFEKFNAAL